METAINNAVATTTAQVVSILTTNIPVVFVVFAGLIALGIVARLLKRYVGRKGA